MRILSGNPKDEPLHYGDVFSIWTHLTVKYGQFHTAKAQLGVPGLNWGFYFVLFRTKFNFFQTPLHDLF